MPHPSSLEVSLTATNLVGVRDEQGALQLEVEADPADARLIQHALSSLVTGELLIGLDWADVRAAAGALRPGRGRAVRIDGWRSPAGAALALASRDLSSGGWGAAFLAVQLIEAADWGTWSIDDLDQVMTTAFPPSPTPLLFTASLKPADRSCVILIGYSEDRG